MVHMRMGVNDILNFIQPMRFDFCEKPLSIIRGIDKQPFPTLLISDQITKDPKISDLILFDNHLLSPDFSRSFQTIIYEPRNFNFLFDRHLFLRLMKLRKKARDGVEKVKLPTQRAELAGHVPASGVRRDGS
jgi:hypothetical protein